MKKQKFLIYSIIFALLWVTGCAGMDVDSIPMPKVEPIPAALFDSDRESKTDPLTVEGFEEDREDSSEMVSDALEEETSGSEEAEAEGEDLIEGEELAENFDEDFNVFDVNSKNVKILGRGHTIDKALWISHSATGIEFNYTDATAVVIYLEGDKSATEGSDSSKAKYSVILNGEIIKTERMSAASKKVVIDTNGVKNGYVSLLKCSESQESSLGIRCVKTDGKIVPTPQRSLNIQFIGDSITCGYGVEGSYGDEFSTSNENALKAYAYLTAKELNADYSLVSFSGYGVVSGYTYEQGNKKSNTLVMNFYDRLGNSDYDLPNGKKTGDISWKCKKEKFDIVVINLGTNDYSYTGNNEDRRSEFRDAYVRMLRTVRDNNPNAVIVCTLGVMGQELCPDMQLAIEQYQQATGDTKIHDFIFDVQESGDGLAVDGHPTATTHQKMAARLSDFLRNLI